MLSTGDVARKLGVAEQKLQELIRRGRIARPPIVGGRRIWRPADIREAEEALGLGNDGPRGGER